MVKISIIIATFNRPFLLKYAIKSVLSQDIEYSFEIIVVDDGNNPETLSVVNGFIEKNIIYTKNYSKSGQAGARNYGVQIAHGVYITFLDDDDIYLPDRLNRQINKILTERYIFISSGRIYINKDNASASCIPKQTFGEITLESIKYGNHIDIGVMLCKDIFLKHGGFDENLVCFEDWDLFIRLLSENNAFKISAYDYVAFVYTNENKVSNNNTIGYHDLANKYRNEFGDKWYIYMISISYRESGRLGIIWVFRSMFKYMTMLPLQVYIKHKISIAIKYIRLKTLTFL